MSDDKFQEGEAKTPAQAEEELLRFWQENKIFEKSLNGKAPKGDYVFYDGPPFATGLPHYGHILASVLKDVVPRYKTMQGYRVPRRWGWDCHGLPLENMIEKELGLDTKKDIEEFGIEKFNKKANDSVSRYASDWKKIIPRVGRFIDMENDYKTLSPEYMESVWWVFKELYDKNLIYDGYKAMHICPRCETTLANFEVNLGYKDITDISVIAQFELTDDSSKMIGEGKTYILAWTTTPWTLPGNVALAVKPDIDYAKISYGGKRFILAKDRLGFINDEYKVLGTFKGEQLIGRRYKPLFDYYKNIELENKENGWKIYGANFITTEDGTGVVHIAPAFGEDDMNLGKEYSLPFIQHVTTDGKFKSEITDFAGLPVKPKDDPSNPSEQAHQSTDIEILKFLAHNDKLFDKEKLTHSYPHCWRCDTPLLNYAASSWFVNVEKIKDQIIENNKKINWIPEHLREGRFGKWLDGARDWAISRSRFWGAPLPVWKCDVCKEIKVVGSIDEIKEESENQFTKLILVRHAESEKNIAGVYDATLDTFGLTKRGVREAKEVSSELKNGDFHHLQQSEDSSDMVFHIPLVS